MPRFLYLAGENSRTMANEPELCTIQPDPAAVFARALSLREGCLKRAKAYPQLNLSESYNGMNEFLPR